MKCQEVISNLKIHLPSDLANLILSYCSEQEIFSRSWRVSEDTNKMFAWSPDGHLYLFNFEDFNLNVYTSKGVLIQTESLRLHPKWTKRKRLIPIKDLLDVKICSRKIYLFHRRISGEYLKSFNYSFKEQGIPKSLQEVLHPIDLAFREDKIYLLLDDPKYFLVIADLEDGKILDRWPKYITSFQTMCLSEKGEVYLIDKEGIYVWVFNPRSFSEITDSNFKEYKYRWRIYRDQKKVTSAFTKLCLYDKNVFVCDPVKGKVRIFTTEGKYLRTWRPFKENRFNRMVISPAGEITFYHERKIKIFITDLE